MNPTKSKRLQSGTARSQQGSGLNTQSAATGNEVISDASTAASSSVPSNVVRTWLSIWVCLHLVALFVSFTSVVEPSGLHARLSDLVHPYLSLGHFAADDRPVYLAHALESEQPHRLEITIDRLTEIDQVADCQWRSVGAGDFESDQAPPGLAVSDRVARWLSTAATLAEHDQPGVVAELLLPIAVHFPEAKALRIVRFPTDLNDVNATATSPYVARVVRTDKLVTLIQLTPKRLSSQAVLIETEPTK